MNPYLIGGLALVAFFLLRGSSSGPPNVAPTGGPPGGAPRTTKSGAPTSIDDALAVFGATGFDQAIEDQVNAVLAAIERGKQEEAARREASRTAVSEAMAGQRTSLAETTLRAAARAPVYGAGRSLTDFGA